VLPSPLGIEAGGNRFFTDLQVTAVRNTGGVEDYELPLGKRRRRRNKWNGLILTVENLAGAAADIEFKAFNDGAAFRYRFSGSGSLTVHREFTGFRFTPGRRAWMQAYHMSAPNKPAYERVYAEVIVGTDAADFSWSAGWCMPALFETGGDCYVLVAESDLDENYCGCRLEAEPRDGLYRIRFPAQLDGNASSWVKPVGELPFTTPWRVMITGTAATVVESTLVDDLARPLDEVFGGTYPDWVQPGRAAWDWAFYLQTGSPPRQKLYIDGASDLGWEYLLIDANWNHYGGKQPYPVIRDLCSYASIRNVDIMLWYNSGGPNNWVHEEPRGRMHKRDVRRREMERISKLGVRGIKVDFFHSDKQDRIRQHLDILKDAAEFHLLVNFHGCTVPRGWQRRFPNLMTMESVFGGEQYGFSRVDGPTAMDNLHYVFTRNVVGPMDYTPVIFEPYMAIEGPTYSHALAQSVLFESSLVHFADALDREESGYQKIFADHPLVKEILSAVPTVWDDTRFISGEPSRYAVLARRSGQRWFAAGFNGLEEPLHIELPLNFLTIPGGRAVLVTDGEEKIELQSEYLDVTSNQSLPIQMAPQGGFTLMITP